MAKLIARRKDLDLDIRYILKQAQAWTGESGVVLGPWIPNWSCRGRASTDTMLAWSTLLG